MIPQLLLVVWLVASLTAAPTPEATPLLSQQYVVLTTPHLAHPQLHYEQPLLKLQPPFFQQITPVGRFETPQKQNLVVLYPNGPLTQYPLLSVRQDGGSGGNEFLQSVQNFFEYIQSLGGGTEAPPTSEPANPPSGGETIKNAAPVAPAAPATSAEPLKQHQTVFATKLQTTNQFLPASTELLTDRRYFILSSQPHAQFYGKYEALAPPLNTIYLQPLQTIQSRSAEPLAQPNALPQPALLDASAQPEPIQAQEVTPLQPDDSFLRRNVLDQPSSSTFEESAQLSVASPLIKAEPLPESDDVPEFNRALPTPDDDEIPHEQSRDQFQGRAAESLEQSVAHAKPSAIALAGQGGVASAKPIATALTGDGGFALAAPSATAVSGDLLSDDDEKTEQNGPAPTK